MKGRHFKKVCEDVKENYPEEIKPVHLNVKRPKWMLGNAEKSGNVPMGNFYEVITKALFGGRFYEDPNFDYREFLDFEDLDMEPDIIDTGNKIIYESKSWRSSQVHNIQDEQLDNYEKLKELNPEWEIYFALYVHRYNKNLNEFNGDNKGLFRELSKKTLCSLVLPLGLIRDFHSFEDEFAYRYDPSEPKYDICTCIRTTVGKNLIANPEDFIKGLGYHNDFSIKKFRSPERMKVEGHFVCQFPILRINDNKLVVQKKIEEDTPF